MRLSPGDRLGPYEIRSLLGAGGMGEVYRACDTRVGRDVALKVLGSELAGNAAALKRFEREARAVAAISHPNIVTLYEFETEASIPIVVTELLEGHTLRMRPEPRMDWRQAAEIAARVADGLAAAHAKHIVHRDLKPDNIFLTNNGGVKILDFGIANVQDATLPPDVGSRDETAAAPTKKMIGTIGYAAPEQLTTGTVAPASDVFSLGIVLYEMVSGTNPFHRNSVAETIAAVLHDDPRPLPSVTGHVPDALDRVIRRCLEKNAGQRFQAASDLADRLREVIREAESPAGARPHRRWMYAATLAGMAAAAAVPLLYRPRVAAAARMPITSVAILPLANTTNDPNFDYVSDGITDTLINQLSTLPNVRITARPTAFQYKAKAINPVAVGKELGVAALATGRVDLHGNNVVIAADLIDAKSGAELWGNTYHRTRDDIYLLPSEIARAIAGELRVAITAPQRARMQRPPTTSAAAFDFYLRGLQALNLNSKEGLEQAIAYFQSTVKADPDFARAWAALAESYTLYSRYADPHGMRNKARDSLQQALRIDRDLAEAHVSSGLLLLWDEWNFRAAENEFRTAIAVNPNSATAHIEYSNTLRYQGRFDEAIREARIAARLDPLSRGSRANVAHALLFSGQLDAAIGELNELLRTESNFADAHYFLAFAYELKGLSRQACDEYVRDDELAPRHPQEIAAGREACRTSGLAAYDRQKLHYYLTYAPLKEPFAIAYFYLRCGNKPQAYAYLERAYEARSANMILLKSDPVFRTIRNEPRFQDLMRRVGFDVSPSDELLAAEQKERGEAEIVQPKIQVPDAGLPEKQ